MLFKYFISNINIKFELYSDHMYEIFPKGFHFTISEKKYMIEKKYTYNIYKMSELFLLAEKYPNMNITVSLEDLMKFGRFMIYETKREIEEKLEEASQEQFSSTNMTADTLGVARITLDRWRKQGYLSPVKVGGKYKYRLSDIKKFFEKKE